jgi:two-component system alkaline phosphatase synthesis response regulator PhoP
VPQTILIIEDERTLADVLADNLQDEGYRTLVSADGSSGLRCWQNENPNLVILDVMLPHLSGFEVCRTMRERGDTTPVLFLSAKGQVEDRVEGLRAGGDDYLPKPFHLPEFLLRVENMLRRQRWGAGAQAAEDSLKFGGHRVDFRAWTATLANGQQEPLGERELKIIRLLSERQNEVVSRDDILDKVWGDDAFPSSRTVDNFVMRLRRLFEPDPANPAYFHTVWGVGYRFTPEGAQTEVHN